MFVNGTNPDGLIGKLDYENGEVKIYTESEEAVGEHRIIFRRSCNDVAGTEMMEMMIDFIIR